MTTSAWDDAFHDLWMHAIRHRGMLISLAELPGPVRDSPVPGWPRTRGGDVLAIAAVIDPVLRAMPPETGGHAIDRHWRDCARDLEVFALDHPEHEYAQNHAFWGALGKVAAYLATIDAPVPETLWRALFAEIASSRQHRHARVLHDDYLGLTADSYDGLWRAQKAALARLRGADLHEPIGDMRGTAMAVPRSTITDALHLAGFWTDALERIEHKPLAASPAAAAALGLGRVQRRWHTAVAEVNAYADSSDPEATYAENHALWRAAGSLATTLAVLDEAPRATSGGRGPRNAYPGEGTYELLWDKQRDDYASAHGFDLRKAPPGRVGQPMKVPRTTHAEILALSVYWNGAWRQLEESRGGLTTERGLDTLKKHWEPVMKNVDAMVRTGNANDVYPNNHEFWRGTFELAQTLDAFKALPTKGDIALGVAQELPERIGKAVGGAVSEVSRIVGHVAEEAGKGLLTGLGKPLLIGGGAALALFLIFRRSNEKARHSDEKAA